MKEIIAVFAPHPDDETLACGGTIVLNVKRGNEVNIVFMTDGRNSHLTSLGIETNPSPEDLKAIRHEEAKRVTRILGVKNENTFFLEYKDGTLEANIDDALRRVITILKKLKPEVVFYPSIDDRHRDHKATNLILRQAISSLIELPRSYNYMIWRPRHAVAITNEIMVDITEVLPTKKAALSEYKSQTTMFSDRQRRPVLTKSFLKRFLSTNEVFSLSGIETR